MNGLYTKYDIATGETIKEKEVAVWVASNQEPPVLCISLKEGKQVTLDMVELVALLLENGY